MDTKQRSQTRLFVVFFWCFVSLAVGYGHMNYLTAMTKRTVTTPVAIWSPEQLDQFQRQHLEQMKFDNMQVACITFALYGESRNKKQFKDTIGVANVIMNRTFHPDFPKSPCQVVIQRHQIEPLARGKALRKYADMAMNGKIVVPTFIDKNEWVRLHSIATKVYFGQLTDPTYGATHFWSPIAQKALGRSAPKWSRTFIHVASLGDHRYYRY